MSARAALSQAQIDRAARVAKAQGVMVTITAKDGTVYQIAPVPLDQKPESTQPAPKKWRARG
jgi:hypothetical protein